MAEPLTLYKLMILSMLSQSAAPLSNTLLSDFFLTKDYTNYFTLQATLHELEEDQFILQESLHNNIQYAITPLGLESLRLLEDKINPEIQEDIIQFMKEHKLSIISASSTVANYYRTPEKKYAVHCELRDKGIPQLVLTLTVPTKAQAQVMCSNWESQTEEIYELIMDQLLR